MILAVLKATLAVARERPEKIRSHPGLSSAGLSLAAAEVAFITVRITYTQI